MESRWTHLTSSILEAIAYDPTRKRLLLRFRTGAVYEYENVPPVIYEEMLSAPSKGRYFSEYVRPDYPYRRVQASDTARAAPVTAGR